MAETSTNPYLALLQQQDTGPTWAQVLQNIGNLGFGLAGGFSQAATSGLPTMAGVGPGLMMGNTLNVQAANAAEQDRLKRAEIGLRAQEYDDKQAERLRKEKQLNLLAGQYGPNGPAPGINVAAPSPPLMGPNGTPTTGTPQPGPDLKTAGAPIVSYLMAQHGLSPLAAATVAGNLYQESGFNPANNTGDGGSAFGMAQWRLDRQTALRNFAAAQPGGPKPATDPQVQLDFLMSEMQGGDMGAQRAYALLKRASTPEEANAAMMHFFRPEGYTPANPAGGHGFANRVANTRALLPQQRPVDPATAPVPGVGPDPDAVPVPPPMAGPRPGLGPRAMPSGPAPDNGVPVAQGDGTGEVVLPRIGLPFPARAPAPAPPGSVPFPVIPAGPPQGATRMPGGTGVDPNAPAPSFMQPTPGGPNVVQPQVTPGPNTPPMAPSIAPSNITPPPVPVLPDRPTLTQADSIRLQSLVMGGHPELAQSEYNKLLQAQRSDILEQHKSNVEVWKQQQNDRQFERGQAALQWRVLDPKNAQMMLGSGYDPTKAYQINQKGEVKPVGGAQTVVNINQKGEEAFSQKMGEMDATRFGDIIKAEGTMNDMASKLGFALSQFKQTYTGPGADAANAFYKTLGAVGFEDAAKKANAAEAAVAVVSQMKPAMRAPGAGSSSDRDMDTFAAALPSLLNLPGGNERITAYFQRMADRATRVRELAQEHSEGGQRPLSRTGFDTAVKNLGPLFTPDELKEMSALGKPPTGPKPPPAGFQVITPGQTTPVPPPPDGFVVRP